jgi:hypothetical protein
MHDGAQECDLDRDVGLDLARRPGGAWPCGVEAKLVRDDNYGAELRASSERDRLANQVATVMAGVTTSTSHGAASRVRASAWSTGGLNALPFRRDRGHPTFAQRRCSRSAMTVTSAPPPTLPGLLAVDQRSTQ